LNPFTAHNIQAIETPVNINSNLGLSNVVSEIHKETDPSTAQTVDINI